MISSLETGPYFPKSVHQVILNCALNIENDQRMIFVVIILANKKFCYCLSENSIFWVATKISVLSFHPQLDCCTSVPEMYGSGVSLRFGQNLYTVFRASCLWFSPFLDSPFTFLAALISLISVLSFLRPERLTPFVKMKLSLMSFHSPKCQLPPQMCPIFFGLQYCKDFLFHFGRSFNYYL